MKSRVTPSPAPSPRGRGGLALALAILTVAACAAPQAPASTGNADEGKNVGAKRITAGMKGDPSSLSETIDGAGGGSTPGMDALGALVSARIVQYDREGSIRAQLAEQVPTLENGLWKLFPDGRMETIWRLKPAARWHDGTPFTSEDVLFTVNVEQDPELALFGHSEYRLVESVEATDLHTVVVRWKQPFIEADIMWSDTRRDVLPKHLLEGAFTTDKAGLTQQPYFAEEFVGTGPFRLREWMRSSHLILEAYDQYVLGRPRIDEILVKFIPDENALIANVLAGEIELTLGRGLAPEQVMGVLERWPTGKVDVKYTNWVAIYPQFLNPNPPVTTNLQFRRALLYAIDRQQMADTILSGLTPVAHSFVHPSEWGYADVESSIVRYDYDPPRAPQLLESIGYRRGADGMFRDAASQPLGVEIRATAQRPANPRAALAVADYWQRVGVEVTPSITSPQMAIQAEYKSTFPGFELVQNPNDLSLARYHSNEVPLAENRWRGNNRNRYANAELDALLDRYLTTISRQQRLPILGQILHHMTEQVTHFPLYYGADLALISNRLVNVTAGTQYAKPSWNAHEWDVR